MATIKRKKVSTKAVSNQKREGSILHNKLFWIISSIVLAIVIAAAVIITVVVVKKKTETEETPDYFAETYTYNDSEVNFTKMSYNGTLMHVNPADYNEGTYEKHVFFFAYDLTSFYPDKAIDDGKDEDDEDEVFYYNSTHKEVLDALILLQYTIDQYNLNHTDDNEDIVLYIIDTSCGTNSNVFTSSKFGNDSDSSCSFTFGYIAGEDGFQASYEESKDSKGKVVTKSLYTTDLTTFYTTISGSVRKFISTGLKLELED